MNHTSCKYVYVLSVKLLKSYDFDEQTGIYVIKKLYPLTVAFEFNISD